MITTTAAGRTWHFDRALGRPTNEHNGKVGGFRYPTDLAIAPGEIIFVLNKGFQITEQMDHRDNGRIGKTTLDEHHLGDFARQDFTWPGGIALDGDGWVYATDEHENVVRRYDPEGIAPHPGGDSSEEWLESWGVTGSAPGQLDGPSGIAFDANDILYVVESRNHRVQKFTKDGQYISGFGGRGTGDGEFDRPWGITIDRDGYVYVVDWGNNRIQKFSADGGYVMSFGTSFGGELNHPANVAVDSEGDVYVTDFGNRRVQVYEPNGDVLTVVLRGRDDSVEGGRVHHPARPRHDQGVSHGQGLHVDGTVPASHGHRDRRSGPHHRGGRLRATAGLREGPRLRGA